MMATATTKGVKISVLTQFQPLNSSPTERHFVFSYKISIENNTGFVIQLLRRHWYIVDPLDDLKEVEGEGVVGQQPIIQPQGVYEYVSGCNLSTMIGKMYGTYLMERLLDGKQFSVNIPEFVMIYPPLLN